MSIKGGFRPTATKSYNLYTILLSNSCWFQIFIPLYILIENSWVRIIKAWPPRAFLWHFCIKNNAIFFYCNKSQLKKIAIKLTLTSNSYTAYSKNLLNSTGRCICLTLILSNFNRTFRFALKKIFLLQNRLFSHNFSQV